MAEKKTTAKKISYEEALGALSEIVQRLESGEAPLEESLALFEKGVKLTKHCNEILDKAELKIKIVENGGNEE